MTMDRSIGPVAPRSPSGRPSVHVALNAAFLDPGVSGGPESYIRGLIPSIAAARPDARVTVLTSRRGAARLVADGWQSFASIVALPADEGERARRLAAETMGVPRWVSRHRPSVVHSLSNLGPVRPMASPHVLTLHDLTFLRVPTFSWLTTQAMKTVALGSARHSARIITATRASLDEIVDLGGVDRSIVDVVPHGRKAIRPVDDATVERVRDEHGLRGQRVILNVAAKRPHKNQEILVRALAELPADRVLVLAGHPEPYVDVLRETAAALGVADRVRLPDHVDNDELEALWKIADVAAFPTLGEGFGLPVIEALDRGLPVACSDLEVLTEVSGGLAHPFDPRDAPDVARAIETAFAEAGDRTREEARRAHAATFTWARAAELTWASYDRAISAGASRR